MVQQDDGKGKRQTLPFRDYSNPQKTYFILLCAICAPVIKDDKSLKPVLSKSNLPSDTSKAGKLLPAFSSRGAYRFGAAAINDKKGVRVTAVEVDSPSYKLRCATDKKLYYLVVNNSIITHVNEDKIHNAEEFEDAIAKSKQSVKLRIYSTTRQRTVDFLADLRE